VHTKFWHKNIKEGDHMVDLDLDERIILERILEKQDKMV
jgi:hypothetical protein